MKATNFFALIGVLMVLLTSCKQENSYYTYNSTENESVTVTKTAITGIWKINKMEYKSSNSSWYSEMTDRYICFEENGTYNFYFYQPSGFCSWRFYGSWSMVNGILKMDRQKLLLLFEDGDYINKEWTLPNTTISCQLSSSSLILDGYDQTIMNAERAYSLPSKYSVLKSYNPNESSSGGGNGSSQGVTDLYLYDYTEWPTKIKVIFKYESDLSVTSAKIYYGEYSASKSVSATVSSSIITATISGLKKNTVYYVKASATTSKGTVTSSESKVMTAIE